ncbi:MAG TPA: mismatch repair protein [Acidobacteriaceae bacterium]|nr:mismatch repair protein [Acidobacteriaceae bacterium]
MTGSMPDSSQRTPRETYQARIAARRAEDAACERRHALLGYLRLALFIAGIAVAWFAFYRHTLSAWWLLAIAAIFVVVARQHSLVLRRRAEARRAIRFFERGIARIDDDWADLPVRDPEMSAADSLFAEDLDLFRFGGLFTLLNSARTSAGEDTLALWLLEPAARDTILSRQAAIAELRGIGDLREELASCGHADFEHLDVAGLAHWGTALQPQIPEWLRWLSPILVALTLCAAARYFITDHGLLLLAVVLVDATITFALQKRTQALFVSAERASESLKLASTLIQRWEAREFSSPLLRDLHQALCANHKSASHALRRLALLTRMMEQRGNFMVRIFDAPLLYSVQLSGAAQAWKRRHGESLDRWLHALAELEALQSLATYSFEHPSDPFPELLDYGPRFEATELGHPLIPDAKCVRNDVAIGGETRLLLVSGSNMSGKSTLLRSIGTNAVLAMAGAPVRAKSLRLTPLHIGASIRVNDSLQEGRSRFYSEILRLRAVCSLADERPPVLFLLDELLDGTNSVDRLTGARGIAHALLASGAIGLISTHDLALTQIGDAVGALRNVHFEERIEDGEMHFDFKLRDGVVTTRNGVALMRMVGLKV